MNENDRLQTYEAQAIALEKEKELEQNRRELEEARREIERLRVTNQQQNFRDVVAKIEQTFNARFFEINQKFEDVFLQLSNLQQAADQKTAKELQIVDDLRLQISNLQNSVNEKAIKFVQYKEKNDYAIARLNRKNDGLAGESKDTKELFMNISSRLDVIYSELNPHTSVILLGGVHVHYTDSICMFNSKENKWINSNFKLPYRLGYHGSVILNGEIYIFGGWDGNERFNSTYKLERNGVWIKLADMNEMRNGIERSSVVFEDEIWVFGGRNDAYGLKTVEKYNKQKNSWTMMPEMREARNLSAVSIINEKFYISGGYNGRNYLDTIEVYDSEKKKWKMFSNMPLALYCHASIVEGTNLIIIGGRKSDNQPSDEVWKIDVMDPKKEWKKMPNLLQARYGHGAVQLENGLMVIGGEINRTTRIDSVEIFDGRRWTLKFPEKRGQFHSFNSFIPLTSKNENIFLQRLCQS